MSDSGKIGVINEVGDLGLGFDELSESDQKKYDDAKETDKNSDSKK